MTALLVDFDGTLIDSERLHQQAITDWLASRGWTDPAFPALFRGRRAADVIVEVAGPWQGLTPETMVAEIWQHAKYSTLDPVPGAAELLAWASSAGIGLGLVTSGNHWWVETALRGVGMLDILKKFDAVITSEEVTVGKPDPSGYLMAAAALATPMTRCCVVEDSPAGIEAGRRAGAGFVIGVSTSVSPGELMSTGADLVLPDLTEVPELLRSWAGI